MLKEKAALLKEDGHELLRKTFRNHIADTINPKRKTRKVFRDCKSLFCGVPHIHQDEVRGKIFSHTGRRIELRKIQ